ncbi:MAG: GNAT family N-acetyltransferase [Sporolactobacillus sp.]
MAERVQELTEDGLTDYLHLLGNLDSENSMPLVEARQMLRTVASYPYYKIFCIYAEERMLATYSLIILDNFGHGGKKIALLEDVVVDETARGQGFGRQMIDDAMNRSREHGCYKLMLSSDSKRKGAHAFYEHLGFQRHGISFRTELIPND